MRTCLGLEGDARLLDLLLLLDGLHLEGELEVGRPGAGDVELLGAIGALDARADVALIADEAFLCASTLEPA
jgi:hypothetical protein